MALPTPSSSGFRQIPNPGFEEGIAHWNTVGAAQIVLESAISGLACVKLQEAGESNDGSVAMADAFPVVPGQAITLTALGRMTTGTPGTAFAVGLEWYDANDNYIGYVQGGIVSRGTVGANIASAGVSYTAPPGAAGVRARGQLNASNSQIVSTVYMDDFSWNYNFPVEVILSSPTSSYSGQESIPYRVGIGGVPSGVSVVSVEYFYMTWDGADFINPQSVAVLTTAPYAVNADPMADGTYGAYAVVTLSNGLELITNSRQFTVGASGPTNTREFKASNSYTFLVGQNFQGLASAMPSTAVVTGAEVVLGYDMTILSRVLDAGIDDPEQATPTVVFDITDGGTVEAVLLNVNDDGSYTRSGTTMTSVVPILEADFSVGETGTSEGKLWTVYEQDNKQSVTVGSESQLFGLDAISSPDFMNKAVGVRFLPNLLSKPSYAGEGEACYRFKIDTFKLRVYFDAGSVEYYFASPDGSQVIKADLVAGYVESGSLANGDASGTLQITNLESIDGDATFIEEGWTIHAGYPVTSVNKIADVSSDMRYNGLPTYEEVESNRSRYMFISANFYGDPDWESIYGVNGVGRAFAYNGEYFYKIVANPKADKDKPRHIANHHSHLALGYGEGRVDLSVVGEPYNFSGVDGASSWAFGDNVTGLLPLSGTILGVFCQKSIWGLSGTTVDNFSNQIISPKMGAIEYTVADMGFPVYANVYGIYTLAQTEQYGDYKGTPLSQDVSPWLRERMQRDGTSTKEVVVAWPVRAKNQYKLAFADGFVLTMTLNLGNQQAPTFSKQKYFMSDLSGNTTEVDMYAQPSIVPAAISSELDHTGKERIHVAPKVS